MSKRRYRATNLGLARDDPEYDAKYYELRKMPRVTGRNKDRKSKVAARAAIRTQQKNSGLLNGFEACVEARVDCRKQGELTNSFIRWTEKVTSVDKNGCVITGAGGIGESNREYDLYLNKNYGSDLPPAYVLRATVKKSQLKDAGYGMFSNVRLERNDIVGVYMGTSPPGTSVATGTTHRERPYLLQGVADGNGGIGSGYPLHLGMHLVNDPNLLKSSDEKLSPVNVETFTDGLMVARRRIDVGDEIFFSYNADLLKSTM